MGAVRIVCFRLSSLGWFGQLRCLAKQLNRVKPQKSVTHAVQSTVFCGAVLKKPITSQRVN